MTIYAVKADLLAKVQEALRSNNLDVADRCVAMYSTICHADTQDKMTDAAVSEYGNIGDPFKGLGDDDEPA